MPKYYCDYCDTYLTHDSVRDLHFITKITHQREALTHFFFVIDHD